MCPRVESRTRRSALPLRWHSPCDGNQTASRFLSLDASTRLSGLTSFFETWDLELEADGSSLQVAFAFLPSDPLSPCSGTSPPHPAGEFLIPSLSSTLPFGMLPLARPLSLLAAIGAEPWPHLPVAVPAVARPSLLTSGLCWGRAFLTDRAFTGALDLSDVHSPPKSPDGKTSAHSGPSKKANSEASQSDTSLSSSEPKSRSSLHLLTQETKIGSFLNNKSLDVKDKAGLCPDGDDMEGDSFFDDPIPKPEKTYGWRSEPGAPAGSLASLSDAPPLKSGRSSLTGAPGAPGAPSSAEAGSKRGNTVLKDLKLVNDKVGSLGLGTGEDDDYVDDFNSTSHRSEKSELSIGEEIEEDLSVEMDDINTSDKLDDLTQDLTVSQLSDVADYLEDVA
ncbi:centrosomal protein 43 isoform X3 [Leopardus geoffroyi]|uniref:centrosomal protein 43 isoform X3 n=1 Tax=Leopardus geoffroyi TaxID=46844 RepID=UPI001E25E8B8|nr:centrosomal protein 43 isoform X3 [Leopardus geoffroyi]